MGNVHMEAAQVNYRGGSKKMSVEEAIKAAGSEITPEEKTWIDSIPALATSNAGKTDQTVIAPEFDAEAGTYSIGDLVMYDGKLYEFTSAHETPGDWDETEVTEKTVSDEIDTVMSGLTNVGTYSASPVKIGKWFNHDLYRVVINCGTLPNNTALTVSTGLQSSVNTVNVYGIAIANANCVPMPNALFNLKLYYDKDNNQIVIETDRDLHQYTGYVTIEYYS